MSDIETQRLDFNFDDDSSDDSSFTDSESIDETVDIESDTFAPQSVTDSELSLSSFREDVDSRSWDFASKIAKYESRKEYELFSVWLGLGRGRSNKYIALTFSYTEAHICKIAEKNNWGRRAADYDRYELQQRLKIEQEERAKIHKEKLEEYRSQQEFLGRSLSADAAKMAALVNRALTTMLASDRELDVRDIPGILNAANKAAEVGRNLQSSALGVDQLLTALEEYED